MHGQLQNARCAACAHAWTAPDLMFPEDRCEKCDARACRPDVVWFGEDVRFLEEIVAAVRQADIFALIGTSGTVHPAAGLLELAEACGAATFEINLTPSGTCPSAQSILLGLATETVPQWVAKLLRS